jgi:small subunit ribosomal protein S25
VKENLPRIRYANPTLGIEVNKVPKSPADTWKPEMTLEYRTCLLRFSLLESNIFLGDGTTKTLDMHRKWSTSILQELMDTAGGTAWERWKAERSAAGLPILGEAPVETPVLEPIRSRTGAAAVLP